VKLEDVAFLKGHGIHFWWAPELEMPEAVASPDSIIAAEGAPSSEISGEAAPTV
jgi:hypothetical protein